MTAIDLATRTVQFARDARVTYDYLVHRARRRGQLLRRRGRGRARVPAVHARGRRAPAGRTCCERWEAADKDPALVDDGALNVVIVGGGPTGVESAGALIELYRRELAKDYPRVAQEQASITLVEAGPALLSMFKGDIRSYTKKTLEKRGVEVQARRDRVVDLADARHAEVGGGASRRTRSCGARVCRPTRSSTSLGIELEKGHRVHVEPDLTVPGHPEVMVVGDIAWIIDSQTDKVAAAARLGRAAVRRRRRERTSRARVDGKDTKPFDYNDKGTMATIGRASAVVQFKHGRTIKGKTASLAWGAVHLALLSTGEDRAKAVIDWTWAGFTHERAGRIVVNRGRSGSPSLRRRRERRDDTTASGGGHDGAPRRPTSSWSSGSPAISRRS